MILNDYKNKFKKMNKIKQNKCMVTLLEINTQVATETSL